MAMTIYKDLINSPTIYHHWFLQAILMQLKQMLVAFHLVLVMQIWLAIGYSFAASVKAM